MTSQDIQRPEPMVDFFDLRADGYDNHIRGYVFTEDQFTAFYKAGEAAFLTEYAEQMVNLPNVEDGDYHIDLLFSLETQQRLLQDAGFSHFELLWQKDSEDLWNAAVYAVQA